MFENEDFDLDEDFLKDVGEKEEEYYSQKPQPDSSNIPPSKRRRVESLDTELHGDITFDDDLDLEKRRKVESAESDLLDDITFDDEPDFAKTMPKICGTSREASESPQVDSPSRKNTIHKILDASDNSSRSKNVSHQNSRAAQSPRQESSRTPASNGNLETSRKTLALEILRRGSAVESSKNLQNSPSKAKDSEKSFSAANRNFKRPDPTEETDRRRRAREIFKKPVERSKKSLEKSKSNDSTKYLKERAIPAPRMTLVRRFPGPAGLLPDCHPSNLDHANFLNGLDLRAIDQNYEDSKISDYCSQNTERLFTGGAWRFMLDDLPMDFLKGHEIATVKGPAREMKENSRAPFVAGVVERMDNSIDNPRLILKDMTDSIEATMHSDIPLAHPNVIEPGVVVLLRDVGLLGFHGSPKYPGPHYHLVIAPRNIVAVYSEKARLVTSPWMESLKKSATDLTRPDDSTEFSSQTAKKNDEKKILLERNRTITDGNAISNDLDDDDDDISFACLDLQAIEDSQIAGNFSKTLTKSPNFTMSKRLRGEETTEIRISGGNREVAGGGVEKSPETSARPSPRDGSIGETTERKDELLGVGEVETVPKKLSEIRSRLSKFRSDDVSTSVATTIAETLTATRTVESSKKNLDDDDAGTFGDDLMASDNDTDDDILSQLDVESIMANYNATS